MSREEIINWLRLQARMTIFVWRNVLIVVFGFAMLGFLMPVAAFGSEGIVIGALGAVLIIVSGIPVFGFMQYVALPALKVDDGGNLEIRFQRGVGKKMTVTKENWEITRINENVVVIRAIPIWLSLCMPIMFPFRLVVRLQ